jgi:hypothetical protein
MGKASTKSRIISIALMLILIACEPSSARKTPDLPQSISNETRVWLLRQARARLSSKAADLQSAPREAKQPRRSTLFIREFIKGRSSPPAMGAGSNLVEALKSALDSSLPGSAGGNAEPDRIQIDVLDGSLAPLDKPARSENEDLSNQLAAELIALGEDGIAIESEGRARYLLPSEMIYKSIIAEDVDEQKAADLLDAAAVQLGLEPGAWRSSSAKLSRFRVVSFAEDQTRSRALSIINGCAIVNEISRAQMLAAARAGGDYLVRAQKPDGSFHYSYNPLRDEASDRAYNFVRHAGAAISLFDLYRVTREARYLDAARLAVTHLKTRFRAGRESDSAYVLDNDGKAKLGANGLALVALASQMELDPKSADRQSAARLANLLLAMQRKDGSFESYYRIKGDEPSESVSLYYPGEAILGLMRLYKLNGDKRLLDGARRGASYLIESQSRMETLPPDAWLMQALEALNATEREPRYAIHAIALAEAMIAEQYGNDNRAGFAGAFRPGLPRATPAASRAEGMLAAYRLARLTSDARASRIAEALKSSARFQLSQQFDRDNSFFLPNAERAAGGFREGLASLRIRIDFVQHNISSLLGIANILD